MASTPAHDEIARVAHGIWESEGRPEGRDREHWRRAQQMLAEGRAPMQESAVEQEGATPAAPEGAAPGMGADGDPAPQAPKRPRNRPAGEGAGGPEESRHPASATPGPRNPDPLPPTTAEGHVEVPSVEDVAGGAVSDDPRPPPARPRRPRR